MRLWIDTDIGTTVDDAVALLAAVAHPAVELVGVSTVGSPGAIGSRYSGRRYRRPSASIAR